MSSGIAAMGHDTLLLTADCKLQPQSFTILVTDTVDDLYTFAFQVWRTTGVE